MATLCNRSALIAGLRACGWVTHPDHTMKHYEVFYHDLYGRRYLVGKSGALRRVPSSGTLAHSHSLTGSNMHRAFMEVGRRAGCYSSAAQARADLAAIVWRLGGVLIDDARPAVQEPAAAE